jgi:hypothetical protein
MTPRSPALALLLAAATVALPAKAAEDDALDLQADPPPAAQKPAAAPGGASAGAPATTTAPASTPRWALELAGLQARRSGGLGNQGGHRLALDLRWSGSLGGPWRFGLSDRLDDVHPAQGGLHNTHNSLREAWVAWQSDATSVEAGRVNLRHGPGYGYNPTDVFRRGATRLITSADPLALRENRLGTYLLRASQLGSAGSAAITWAPKLSSDGPSDASFSLDPGATNQRQRVLLTASGRASERWSGEVQALAESGGRSRLGANFTGLATDWLVLHGELSNGKVADLLDVGLGQPAPALRRSSQAVLGATFTLPSGLAVTAEAEYNGAGLDRAGWQQLFANGPVAAARLFGATQADQELASRRAWLLYATQKGVGLKQLDVTGFVRHNPLDHSSLAWVELRYHWPKLDTALQWQRSLGGAATEYGALPYRQVVQLVGTLYF